VEKEQAVYTLSFIDHGGRTASGVVSTVPKEAEFVLVQQLPTKTFEVTKQAILSSVQQFCSTNPFGDTNTFVADPWTLRSVVFSTVSGFQDLTFTGRFGPAKGSGYTYLLRVNERKRTYYKIGMTRQTLRTDVRGQCLQTPKLRNCVPWSS